MIPQDSTTFANMWIIPHISTIVTRCGNVYIYLNISVLWVLNKLGMKYAMGGSNFKPMRIKWSFFALALLMIAAVSCNVERSEKYQTLLAERDSLYTEAVAAKGGFDHALNTINAIENALEAVRAQENIIMMDNQEGNTNKAVSEINAIQQTLQENRNKINDLEKQLAEQGSTSKALKQTVSRLKKQLEEKDT